MEPLKKPLSFNLKTIFGILTLCIFSFIVGNIVSEIFFPSTPEGIVNGYMKAWRINNTENKREFSCFSEEPVEFLDLNVQSWEVLGKNEKVDKNDPDSKYFEVLVKVKYLSKNNFSVNRTIIFKTWNSDELFESNKRTIDQVGRVIEKSSETVNIINEALGKPIENNDKRPLPVLTRDQYSGKKYCVTKINVLSP